MSGTRGIDDDQEWLVSRTRRAPGVLKDRILESATSVPPGRRAEALAETAWRMVRRVAESPGDRSVALDLLAADALITLALLAQSEAAPALLSEFAGRLLRPDSAGA